MIIVQLSDLHIVAKNEKVYGHAPTSENLLRCVEHINQLNPPADVVLVTGDITNNCSIDEALHAAAILDKLECPFYIVPGNHDSRDTLRKAFNKKHRPECPNGYLNYVVDDFALRLIGLDSLNEGKPSGKLSLKHIEWLEARLAEDDKKPTIIFMHHPPVKCGVLETDVELFEGEEYLANALDKVSNIERILCGHTHTPAHICWHGTTISVAPSSTGMDIELDLSQEKPSQFYLDKPQYLLHYWSPEKNLISYHIQVESLLGPYPFVGRSGAE